MDFDAMIARMDADTCAALRRAIELGKFPGGHRLTEEQRALCMEAVLVWEGRNLPPDQRTGYINRGSKAEGDRCKGDDHDHDDDHGERPLHVRGGR